MAITMDIQSKESVKQKHNFRLKKKTRYPPDKPVKVVLQCLVCDKTFSQKSSLKFHMMYHLNVRKYECAHCSLKFRQRVNLVQHLQKIHPQEEELKNNMIACEHCNSYFKNNNILSRHLIAVHANICQDSGPENTDSGKYIEYKNTLNFQAESDILSRALEKSDISLVPEVNICTVKITLERGRRIFHCSICKKTFGKLFILRRHMTVHSTAKPYKCPLCPVEFKYSSALRIHAKKLHKFECSDNRDVEMLKQLNSYAIDIQKGLTTIKKTAINTKGVPKMTSKQTLDTSSSECLETGVPGLSMPIIDMGADTVPSEKQIECTDSLADVQNYITLNTVQTKLDVGNKFEKASLDLESQQYLHPIEEKVSELQHIEFITDMQNIVNTELNELPLLENDANSVTTDYFGNEELPTLFSLEDTDYIMNNTEVYANNNKIKTKSDTNNVAELEEIPYTLNVPMNNILEFKECYGVIELPLLDELSYPDKNHNDVYLQETEKIQYNIKNPIKTPCQDLRYNNDVFRSNKAKVGKTSINKIQMNKQYECGIRILDTIKHSENLFAQETFQNIPELEVAEDLSDLPLDFSTDNISLNDIEIHELKSVESVHLDYTEQTKDSQLEVAPLPFSIGQESVDIDDVFGDLPIDYSNANISLNEIEVQHLDASNCYISDTSATCTNNDNTVNIPEQVIESINNSLSYEADMTQPNKNEAVLCSSKIVHSDFLLEPKLNVPLDESTVFLNSIGLKSDYSNKVQVGINENKLSLISNDVPLESTEQGFPSTILQDKPTTIVKNYIVRYPIKKNTDLINRQKFPKKRQRKTSFKVTSPLKAVSSNLSPELNGVDGRNDLSAKSSKKMQSPRKQDSLLKPARCHSCDFCFASFLKPCDLKRHKVTHLVHREMFTCDICLSKLMSKKTLTRHIKKHERRIINSCQVSQSNESNSDTLVPNQKQEIKPIRKGPKMYTCETCSKQFLRPSHLKRHQVTHDSKKKSVCKCGASFNQKAQLVAHKSKYNNKPHACPYTCVRCLAVFPCKSELNKHNRVTRCEPP